MTESIYPHFNPSTLKVMYNAVTEKVEATVVQRCNCYAVGDTPLYFTVEISGVLECEDKPGADAVNDIWKCRQTESPYVEAEYCYWTYQEAENVWIEIFYDYANDTLMVYGSFWAAPANWYSAYAYIIDGTADCDDLFSGTDAPNRNTECTAGWKGFDGIASWCRDWHPGGC